MPAADKAPSLKLLFLVLALFAFAMDGIYAQSIQLEIIVSNSQDQQPLPFCNLYLHHHGIGQSTNHQGKAILNFKPSRKQDTLSISFIGFEPKSIPVDLQKSSSIEIKLEPSTHLLNAAIVKYVKPPHPKSILKKAIRKTDENYPTGNNLMEGYYRETIKEDGKFIQFNDAQVELFYTGYPNKNLDRKQWQDWFHDDRYVFDLEANSWFYELLHDFNHPDDRMAIKASRSSENWSKHQFETVLMGGPLSLTSLDKIKYQYDFLNPDLLNNYNLKLEGEVNQNGTLCYLIRFHPKESNKRFRIDQSRKNKRAIYIGEIFIEKSSFAVVKFSYQLAVDRDYGFFAKRMPLANSTEVNYARSEDFWFLHSVTSTEKKVFKRFEDGSVLVHEGTKFLRIDQLTPTEKSPFTEDDVFKSTLYSTLRYYRKANRPQVMQEWFSENGMKINEQVVKYLSTTTALDSQFIHRYLPKKDLPRPNPLDFGSKNDDFIWMKDPKKSEDLIGYLNLENTYAKNFLLEERAYQQSLYNSLNKFYKTPEKSSATRSPGDLYYDQDSLNFTFLYEYVDSTFSTPIFNLSAFRDAHPDAYYIDPVLNESKTQVLVQFKLPDELNGLIEVHTIGDEKGTLELNKIYSIEWLNDSTLVSAHANDLEQSNQLYQWNTRSNLGELIYEEKDSTFDVALWKGQDLMLCTLQSKSENEILELVNASGKVSLKPLTERKTGVTNVLKANKNHYFLLSNEGAPNGKLLKAKKTIGPLVWEEVIAHHRKDQLVDFTLTENFLVVKTYEKTIAKVKYTELEKTEWNTLSTPSWSEVDFNEGSLNNDSLQYNISGLNQVPTGLEGSLRTGEFKEIYKAELNSSYLERALSCTRKMVKGHDGVKIPLTIAKSRAPRKDHKGTILRVYGAYGAMTYPYFSAEDAVLMQNGYTIACAHVRGDGVLGSAWYEDGKLLNKKNSILDYISCAEYLIKEKITTPEHLVGHGNSAGGLVVAAAINERPELFNTVILDHPFVNVLHSMIDPNLPLTIDEYKEWGDPSSEEAYDYIKSYCPYEQLSSKDYPNVIILSGFEDKQTPCWQQAMYMAKLRSSSSENNALMITDLHAGHIGSTVGNNWIKQFSLIYSFVEMMQPD